MLVVALATRPLVRRGFIPHLRPAARQRVRAAELSGRQGGLWLHSWGLAVAPSLQAPLSPFSTSHISSGHQPILSRVQYLDIQPISFPSKAPTGRWEHYWSGVTLRLHKPVTQLSLPTCSFPTESVDYTRNGCLLAPSVSTPAAL